MGLTGFNRQRKQALAKVTGDMAIADKLVSQGINEPEKLKQATKEDLSFLSDEELKKLDKATQAQEEDPSEAAPEAEKTGETGQEMEAADVATIDKSYPEGVDPEKAEEAFDQLEDPDFPEHWYSGHYFLSDGSVVKGKEDATQAQEDLNGG